VLDLGERVGPVDEVVTQVECLLVLGTLVVVRHRPDRTHLDGDILERDRPDVLRLRAFRQQVRDVEVVRHAFRKVDGRRRLCGVAPERSP
jgi:hypothetical protein